MPEMRCPNCGILGEKLAEDHVHWECGSYCRGNQQWQSESCRVRQLEAEAKRLRLALAEIAKGEGPFKRDPLAFAESCIEHMKALAAGALQDEAVNAAEEK